MKFYHEKKAHMSPSAFDNWHRNRAAFVGSYFEEKAKVDTAAMRGGREIHRLIEGGFLEAKHVYDGAEDELKVQVPGSDFHFLGMPDSYTTKAKRNQAAFVDYKSGKANEWKEKLPTDLKMKATAWLVWIVTGQPGKVLGAIEYFATTWDPEQKKVVPISDRESEIIDIVYTAEELQAFTGVIIRTMEEVNAAYEKWLNQEDLVSREDLDRYEELAAQVEPIELEMDEIKERIKTQMEFGGKLTHKASFGTFSIRENKTYAYPPELPVITEKEVNGLPVVEEYTLEETEEIGAAAKTAMKNFELISEPVTRSTSISFRAAKEKK